MDYAISHRVWVGPKTEEPRVHFRKPDKWGACKLCRDDREGESVCWSLANAMFKIGDERLAGKGWRKGHLFIVLDDIPHPLE
jgi:hypothetical protein